MPAPDIDVLAIRAPRQSVKPDEFQLVPEAPLIIQDVLDDNLGVDDVRWIGRLSRLLTR